MRTFIRFLIIALPVFICIQDGTAQKGDFVLTRGGLNLATNSTKGLMKPFVVITWPAVEKYTQFNLYRKSSLLEEYPRTPLNEKLPLAVFEDCEEIRQWISQDGPDWDRIGYALGSEAVPFNPCAIAEIPRSSTQFERLQMLARSNWRIAVILGQGFQDTSVTNGTTYYYELRAIDPNQKLEIVLASDVSIVAGIPVKLPAPSEVDAIADDNKNLVLWSEVSKAAGYIIYRATAGTLASPQRVNDATLPAHFTHDLQGATIPVRPGFVDYMVWDEYGNPIPRVVEGQNVTGPDNGVTYYYKVSALDMLGYEGALSAAVAMAMPVDLTPPMTPGQVSINANDPLSQLEISWSKVTYDVNGHVEPTIQGYRVYRYDIPDSTMTAVAVGGLIPQTAAGFETVTLIDNDPTLRQTYGEKTFWYRIKCIDSAGNESALSASSSGYLNDITPPGAPKNVKAEGFEGFIRVMWDPNSEPDLDGYLIYRSLCEFGEWTCVSEEGLQRREKEKLRECPEVFKLIGYLSQDEARAIMSDGSMPFFDDGSVSSEAPICYAYLVKAIDESQNENGSMPPDLTKETIVCQRIRDKTPPDPAIVSSLLARDNAVFIEWIGAPVQDIAAYHVYRSEDEMGSYKWIGGMTVERPGVPAASLSAPYTPPAVVGCNEIALVPQEYMSTGSLYDKIDPKIIFWYKVLGIDFNGNESPVEDAVGVSTFTFSTNVPIPAQISAVAVQSPTCALSVEWTPTYNASNQRGFIVFRSGSSSGQFLQISELLTTNTFIDTHVVRGIEYWYRVVSIDRQGNVSQLGVAKSGKVSP